MSNKTNFEILNDIENVNNGRLYQFDKSKSTRTGSFKQFALFIKCCQSTGLWAMPDVVNQAGIFGYYIFCCPVIMWILYLQIDLIKITDKQKWSSPRIEDFAYKMLGSKTLSIVTAISCISCNISAFMSSITFIYDFLRTQTCDTQFDFICDHGDYQKLVMFCCLIPLSMIDNVQNFFYAFLLGMLVEFSTLGQMSGYSMYRICQQGIAKSLKYVIFGKIGWAIGESNFYAYGFSVIFIARDSSKNKQDFFNGQIYTSICILLISLLILPLPYLYWGTEILDQITDNLLQANSIAYLSTILVVGYAITLMVYYPMYCLSVTKSFYEIPGLKDYIQDDVPNSWWQRFFIRLFISLTLGALSMSGINLIYMQSFMGGACGSAMMVIMSYCCINYYKTSEQKPQVPIFFYHFFAVAQCFIALWSIYQDWMALYNKEHNHQI